MISRNRIYLLTALCLLLTISCENPLKEDKKKELVITFIDDYFLDTGRYVFFWDGKDENRKYVRPGRYIVLLEIKDQQDQEYITAEEGGKAETNDQSHFEPGYWIDHDLEEPYPEPFRVQSGINIPVLIAEPTRAKISIYKD